MEVEKLPSGSYRIRIRENGKRYSLTVPYKPKKDEAYKLIIEHIYTPVGKYDLYTFREALKEYIRNKENVLSPTTIRGYEVIERSLPESFMNQQLNQILF